MKHIHKRFSVEQIKLLLSAYLKRRMTREEVGQELGIGKTRFFALLKRYKQNPDVFLSPITGIPLKSLPMRKNALSRMVYDSTGS